MPKVTYVKSARKDYPEHDIAKGDSYYWWAFRYGGKRYSKTPPRPSQLTQSDKLSRVYATHESIEDVIAATKSLTDVAALADTLSNAADEVREVASEYTDAAEAVRENFSESPTADDCEEKAQELEAWADTLDQASQDLEGFEPGEGESESIALTRVTDIAEQANEEQPL